MKLTEKHVAQGMHRADGDLTALAEHLNLVLKRSDEDLVRENRRLRSQLARLEGLRPHWAQGFTDASVAAQVKTAELVRVAAERDALQALLNERDAEIDNFKAHSAEQTLKIEALTETHVLYTWLRRKADQHPNDVVAVYMNIGHDWTPVQDLDRVLRTMIEAEQP